MKQKSWPDKVPVARKGIRLNRRRIASSVDFSLGLLLPAMMILNCGTYSKKSPRMNRADTSSPPVIVLILFSSQVRPRSVSRGYGPASHQSGRDRWVLLTAGGNERLQIVLAAARPARK
jgi:hypothetical protein